MRPDCSNRSAARLRDPVKAPTPRVLDERPRSLPRAGSLDHVVDRLLVRGPLLPVPLVFVRELSAWRKAACVRLQDPGAPSRTRSMFGWSGDRSAEESAGVQALKKFPVKAIDPN